MSECPSEIELARALAEGARPALEIHLTGCPECRSAWQRFRAAIDHARQLPLGIPSASQQEEMRTAILASLDAPARRRTRHRTWLVSGFAVAAAAAFVIASVATGTDAPRAHGTVRAERTARFSIRSFAPDEIVRVEDGRVDIEVTPLANGERFRVIVGDAEIEVRGTAFEVTAHDDQLDSVTVRRGRVEVRRMGTAVVLDANQTWRRPTIAEQHVLGPAAPAAVAIATPPSAGEPRKPRAQWQHHANAVAPEKVPSPQRSGEDIAYEDAWTAMREQHFARAAALFERVVSLAPNSSYAEDAAFWHGVALARASLRTDAIAAFRMFLAEHAHSPRAGETSAMLGWLLVDAHELDEAERRFRAAENDANPAVARSARAGLDALLKKASR